MDNRLVMGLVDMRQGNLPSWEGVSAQRCGRDVAGLIHHSWHHNWSAVAQSNKQQAGQLSGIGRMDW